jgi:pimeloyl-ACP methyl ester carboxylesterase
MTVVDAVLLLHGQPGSGRDWDRVAAALGTDANAIAVDRPGWDGKRRAVDLAGNVAAAIQTLDERGIDRAMVVGHSLGGAVAALMAIEYPARVEALLLASPAANAAAIGWPDAFLAWHVVGPVASVAAMSSVGLALTASPLRRRIARGLGLDEQYLDAASRGLLSASAWRAFVSEQRMLVRELPDLDRRLVEIVAPTTVVYGSTDRVVPAGAAQALTAKIKDAKLVVIEGAGHLLPQRHAPRLAELILGQLTVSGPRPPPRRACP